MRSPEGVSRPGAQWWLPEHPSLELIRTGVNACGGCELRCETPDPPVAGQGPLRPPLMVVAAAPEDAEAPYDAEGWQLVDAALRRGGLEPDDVYRTHLVKHPHDPGCADLDGGCGHAAACLPWLWAEVAVTQPDAVVLLGDLAGSVVHCEGSGEDYAAVTDATHERELAWPRAASRWAPGQRSWSPRRCLVLPEPPVGHPPAVREAWTGRLVTLAHVHGHRHHS